MCGIEINKAVIGLFSMLIFSIVEHSRRCSLSGPLGSEKMMNLMRKTGYKMP